MAEAYLAALPPEIAAGVIVEEDGSIHLGKRAAAGAYCWDCDVTLAIGGKSEIHMGRTGQLNACPNCGKPIERAPIQSSANPAGIELGLARAKTVRPTGVGFCSSFTWAQDPESIGVFLQKYPDDEVVVDEYDRRMAAAEFLEMIEVNCPVQFTDSIGHQFW
jgi:predicted RNA-binding Zn-ribbon protein involved in translation (DUF1610 family)